MLGPFEDHVVQYYQKERIREARIITFPGSILKKRNGFRNEITSNHKTLRLLPESARY